MRRSVCIAIATVVAAQPCASAEPSAEESTRLVAVYEASLQSGPDGPGFRRPRAVSTDPLGNVFVADTGNHRVLHFDALGRFVFEFGGYGWDVGELSSPTDVSAREGFKLFVADSGNERIQWFDISDSSPEGAVFPFQEGEGLEGEALVLPSRLSIDPEGRVYVSDPLCHCVWIFTPTGELLMKLGGLGSEPARFRDPSGVIVGRQGTVYVADSGNHRIQVFDSIGSWVAAWGGPEDDPLVRPVGVDVDPAGNVWVADAGSAWVRVFTPAGIPLFRFGGPGEGPGRFRSPVDVAVGRDGVVYVVDEEREVVERYRVRRETEER
ncbi:MAG: NHL repeat-containing protein [bacterium]